MMRDKALNKFNERAGGARTSSAQFPNFTSKKSTDYMTGAFSLR